MQYLEDSDMHYEGEIIDMLDFLKKKTVYNKKGKNRRNNDIDEKFKEQNAKIDDLSLKFEDISQKLDTILNTPSEKIIENDNIKNNKLLNYFNTHPFKTSVAASIIATLIINLLTIFYNYILIPSRLSSIESKLDTQISNYNDNKSETDEKISQLKVNVSTIANVMGINLYSDLEYTDEFISKLSTSTETVENKYYSSAPPCQDNEIIAINSKNGKTYTKEQLVGEKLLIPYTCGGQEVLFYGQYNENDNWDKDCTINVYENDKLVLISETEYKNGIPSYSKQAFPSKTKEGIDVWSISDRKYNGNFNYGETWNYFKFNECSKTFVFENVEISDIIYVSNFEIDIKTYSYLEGYYCGTNQNGVYNDNNSDNDSYMVKYDRDGFIRTLYIGNFKNGDFDDHTGKAEEIVFDGTVNRYFHYVGTFTEGNRDGDNLKYITQEEINEIIKPYNFNCELNWHDTQKDTN